MLFVLFVVWCCAYDCIAFLGAYIALCDSYTILCLLLFNHFALITCFGVVVCCYLVFFVTALAQLFVLHLLECTAFILS